MKLPGSQEDTLSISSDHCSFDFQGQRRQEGGETGKSKEVNLGEVELSNKVRSKMSRESGQREGLLYIMLVVERDALSV